MTSTGKKGYHFTNWAKTYSSDPEYFYEARSRDDLVQILNEARQRNRKVRIVGNGHSPSDLACTTDNMISMRKMNRILNIDCERCQIKVESGALISEMNEVLANNGLSFSVLGSVDDITIGGAVSTGTHGTGAKFGSLSTSIVEMELMKASGEVINISRETDAPLFRAACLGLGCLGIILTLTLQCEKAFNLHKTLQPAKLDQILDDIDKHVLSCDHFRFTWFPYADVVTDYSSRTTQEPFNDASWFWDKFIGYHILQFLYWISTFFGCLVPLINRFYYWILFSTTRQVSGVSYKVFAFECLFNQYVEEWAIGRDKAATILQELKAWIEKRGYPAHFPIEVRFVKADDLMISPASDRETCFINIITYRPYNREVLHDVYFRAFEEIMKKHGGRPHWAKDYHVTPTEFERMYPEWQTFCQIRRRMDPEAMFINNNLERVFGVNL